MGEWTRRFTPQGEMTKLQAVDFLRGMVQNAREMYEGPKLRIRNRSSAYIYFWTFIIKYSIIRKLTVAQLHTNCLGIGFNLIPHWDLILATEDCKIGHVEERLGQGGMTVFLDRKETKR